MAIRVIVLTQSYLPTPISIAKLIYDLATEMSEMGHEVTVVTPDDSLKANTEISKEDGVTVVRVRTRKIRHPIQAVRAFREARLSATIWKAARPFFETHPCDLVVYYTPTIFWSGLVNKLKAINRCGSYQIMRDSFPQWLLDTGLLSKYGLVYWYFRRHELKLYRASDVIGVQSPANLEYFSKPPLDGKHKVEVLFNWAKIDQRPVSSGGWRRALGLEGKVIFVYGGMISIPQDMDNIVRLAGNLRDEKDVFFLLVGEGSETARIAREIRKGGLNNIKLHPAVSQNDYLSMLAECDIGLITLRRDLKTHNFPGKMLAYMQMGKPILASINPGSELGTILAAHGAGLVCDNGEDALLCQHARSLAHDPALRQRMGENGLCLLRDKFSVSSAARQILAHTLKRFQASLQGAKF